MTKTYDDKFGRDFLDNIIDWIRSILSPEDVFSDDQLRKWAESNGYIEEK